MAICSHCKTKLTSAAIEFRRCTNCGCPVSGRAATPSLFARLAGSLARMFGRVPLINIFVSPENRIGTRETRQTIDVEQTHPNTESTPSPDSTATATPDRDPPVVPPVQHSAEPAPVQSDSDGDVGRQSDGADGSDIMETMKVSADEASELASLAKLPDQGDEFEAMETMSDLPADGEMSDEEFDSDDDSRGAAMQTMEEVPSARILSEVTGETDKQAGKDISKSTKTMSDASDHTVASNEFVQADEDSTENDDDSAGMQTISDDVIGSVAAEEFEEQPIASSESDDASDAMQTIENVAINEASSEFQDSDSDVDSAVAQPSGAEPPPSASSSLGSFGSMGIDGSVSPVATPEASLDNDDQSLHETVDEIAHDADSDAVKSMSESQSQSNADKRDQPHQLGKFEIVDVIGSGTFGSVYKSRDPELDRDVAIKVPHVGMLESKEDLERFVREGRAAAALRHPNICPVYEIGKHGDQHFIVMAYIKGKTLAAHLAKRRKFSARQAAIATRKLAQALQVAHELGIIHRDLKPANIIIDDFREPVIMDFGLARRENANEVKLTQTGQIMGTPAYMAPEQASGDVHAISPVTDIYSLGSILYEMLTGRRPFQGSVGEVMAKVLTEDPIPVSVHRKDVDSMLESICQKAMAKKIDDRYVSMAELAADLSSFLTGETPEPKPDPASVIGQVASPRSLKLVVTAGADSGQIYPLSEELNLIGRSRLCAVTINDPAVSKIHCRIRIFDNKAEISDANSSWGTIVNGERITVKELRPGDSIKLGATRFLVEDAENVDASEYRSEPDTVHPGQNRPAPAVHSVADDAPTAPPQRKSTAKDAESSRAYPKVPETDNLLELVGTKFIRYEIREVLARARTGMLFHAHDTKKDRPVALKVLWPELAKQREEVRRFIRAIKTMMGIKHDSLIALYGAGKTGSYCFTASEYVDGESLTDVIKRIGIAGMLEWQYPFRVMLQIARALEVAYQHRIVHRNISPQNIMVRSSDKLAKLGDLMLAKALEGTLAEKITRPGEIVGELAYLSPEQTSGGQETDCRADIYSLGATAYAILTGRPPLEGNSPAETIKKIRDQRPDRPTKYHLSVPGQLDDIVMRMLEKRPADRYQTPTQLVRELEQLPKYHDVSAD